MTNFNQVNDDSTNRAKSSLNQKQNVYPIGDGFPTNISSIGAGYGSLANPGPAGFGGDYQPGRRIWNPLSQFASYTYNLSLYMLTPNAYKAFVESGRRTVSAFNSTKYAGSGLTEGAFIVAQSGGINDSTQQRAPGFEYDYYIDDLKFKVATSTMETGVSSTTNWDISFKIVEPYGFSFLTNLRTATAALQKIAADTQWKNANAWKQLFVLGIRYYGYDDRGNIIKPSDPDLNDPNLSPIDSLGTDAVFENFFDIQISNVKFKLGAGANTYDVTAHGINSNTLLGTARGRTPATFNIVGKTVAEALENFQNQLNARQEDLKKSGSITVKNEYKFTFAPETEILQNAQLSTETNRNRFTFVPTSAQNVKGSNELAGQEKPNFARQRFTINLDFPFVQAFDMIIKRSEFLENAMAAIQANQQNWVDPFKNTPVQNTDPAPLPLIWYTVTCNVVEATWDDFIQNWAFKTEYVFQTYKVPNLPTTAASSETVYYGPYKRYEFFLTGKNSEVLDLSLNYNNLYNMAVLNVDKNSIDLRNLTLPDETSGRETDTAVGNNSGGATKDTNATSNNTGLIPDSPSQATTTSPTVPTATGGGQISLAPGILPAGPKDGQLGVTGSDKTSILTYLNDASAYASAKMTILGDPDFMSRDSVQVINDIYNRFYDTNGYTISATGGQIFIEVAIKQAEDYNDRTGVMPLMQDFYFVNHPKNIREMSQGAMIFQVRSVQSIFSGGKFIQNLDLMLPTFRGDGDLTAPLQSTDQPPLGVFKDDKWPTQTNYGVLPGLNDDTNKTGVNIKNVPTGGRDSVSSIVNTNYTTDIFGNRVPLATTNSVTFNPVAKTPN